MERGSCQHAAPRIYSIIKEIDYRFRGEHKDCSEDSLARMCVIGGGQVRMANLAVIGSHSVNGVSALHSDIIKESVFRDFYGVFPERLQTLLTESRTAAGLISPIRGWLSS